MQASPTLSRTSSRSELSHTSDAALIGANIAFGVRPVSRRPSPAIVVTEPSATKLRSKLSKLQVGDSSHLNDGEPRGRAANMPLEALEGGVYKTDALRGAWTATKKDGLCVQTQSPQGTSLSHGAAQLAAARSSSPETRTTPPSAGNVMQKSSRNLAKSNKGEGPSHPRQEQSEDVPNQDVTTDSTPIATTSSLVGLFERKTSNAKAPAKRSGPTVVRPSDDLAVRSPKPLRTSDDLSGLSSVFAMEIEKDPSTAGRESRQLTSSLANNFRKDSPSIVSIDRHSLISDGGPSEPLMVVDSKSSQGTSDVLDATHVHKQGDGNDKEAKLNKSVDLSSSHTQSQRPGPSKPIQIPAPSQKSSPPNAAFSTSSQKSGQSITAQYNQMYTRRMTPLNTGDQLANAIVASSLASSRAPSPRKLEPPSVPSRRTKLSPLGMPRTPSPIKHSMLHTLRRNDTSASDESEDERHPYGKHRKKRLVRKHPNKHHEGDRKRWRDAVTERERKRYDGVWAANRGLYCAFVPSSRGANGTSSQSHAFQNSLVDRVSNLVVRDIWTRSRLPTAVLETIWDLVDTDAIGRLNKEEFVIGLWLIDQYLKGRKLPVKVSESVWASVRGLQGIKIRK